MKRRSLRATLVVAVLGALALIASACVWEGAWTVVPAPQPPPPSHGGPVSALDCIPSTGHCVAVGSGASLWNGSTWLARPTPPVTMGGLSCWSDTGCLVAGGANALYRYDGVGYTDVGWPATDDLVDLSCATATMCMVVGRDASDAPLVRQWNGSTFLPTTFPAASSISAVSCPSATLCLAVGSNLGPWAARWTGGATWSALTVTQTDGAFALGDVSCSTTTSCTATVGYYNTGTTYKQLASWGGSGFVGGYKEPEQEFSSGWLSVACAGTPERCLAKSYWPGGQSLASRPSAPGLSVQVGDTIGAYDCASASSCVALTVEGGLRHAHHFNGTSWAVDEVDQGPSFPRADDVSCAPSGFCMGVGSFPLGSTVRRVVVSSGAGWTLPAVAEPSRANLGVEYERVSCSSATFCVVTSVEKYPSPEGDYTETYFDVWNGSTWSTFYAGALISVSQPLVVSCTSPTFCLAGAAGGAYTWDGLTWTLHVYGVGHSWYPAQDVVCASPTSCLVVTSTPDPWLPLAGASSDVLRWDGSAFTPVTIPVPAGQVVDLHGVDCAGTDGCFVVGRSGAPDQSIATPYIAQGAPTGSWTAPALPAGGTGGLLTVSCSNLFACLAIGSGTVGGISHDRLALAWNGSEWKVAPDLPVSPPGPTVHGGFDCVATTCLTLGEVSSGGGTVLTGARYTWTNN